MLKIPKSPKCTLLRLWFLAGCMTLFLTQGVFAIEVTQVEPAKVRVITEPGTVKTGVVTLTNPSHEVKIIKAYLEDWVYLPACDGTKDFRPAGTTELSAADWISFSPAEFRLPPFGKQVLNYTVRIPQDAKGGRYAVLFFENVLGGQDKTTEGVSVNLAIRVASLFYIEPKGNIERKAKIEDIKVVNKGYGNIAITLKFSNIGNVDITTKGTYSIIDKKGKVYARGAFNDSYTFPGYSTILTAKWKELIPQGAYDLILTIDTGRALEELGLGRGPVITKEAQIVFGEKGEVISLGKME